MSKFTTVGMMVVDANGDAWHTGWAVDCKTMLRLSYPGLPYTVFQDPAVIKMMNEVDNETGTLFVMDPVEGKPLMANSSYDKLMAEVKQ